MKIFANILIYVGLLLICVGVALPIFTGVQQDLYRILYTAGAVLSLAGRILDRSTSSYLRVKRLLRLQIWSSVFFCVAAFFVWFSNTTQDWLAFTLAGGAVLCYVSIALPFVQKKAMAEVSGKSDKSEEK